MNPEKDKPVKIRKLLQFLLICVLCFAIGLIVMLVVLRNQVEQQIIAPRIEGQQIDNTPFYMTYNDDLNTALANLSYERIAELDSVTTAVINGLMEVSPIDMERFQALGAEIQENMRVLMELTASYYGKIADDDDLELMEEYFQAFKNLQLLREQDRFIASLMPLTGNPLYPILCQLQKIDRDGGKIYIGLR